MRKIMLSGHIVADAQKQVTSSGREYITFRLGNTEFNNEKGSDGKPIAYWFRITSFNSNHANLAKYLTKGKNIIVVGGYNDNIYQNSKTGNCEISREVIADSIDFINSSSNTSNSTAGTYSQRTSAPTASTPIPQVTASIPSTDSAVAANSAPVNGDDDMDDLPF